MTISSIYLAKIKYFHSFLPPITMYRKKHLFLTQVFIENTKYMSVKGINYNSLLSFITTFTTNIFIFTHFAEIYNPHTFPLQYYKNPATATLACFLNFSVLSLFNKYTKNCMKNIKCSCDK